MASPVYPFFTGTFTPAGQLIANLIGRPEPQLPPEPVTLVEFRAYVPTDMANLLLWRLPEGFMSRLSVDTIVTDFRAGDTVRMFGEFQYSRPIDVPVGGTLTRLQETDGNAVAYEVKNLGADIVEVLENAGHNNALVADLLFGGNDKIIGSIFSDVLMGFAGDDLIDADAGNDAVTGDVGADTIHGGEGDDLLLGAADNDQLYGDGGNDELRGGDGHDQLLGGAGNDVLMGNVFNDTLTGGDGSDILYGGQGWDLLLGGDGDDFLYGDKGFDALYGGAGADTFYFGPNSGVDRIHDFNAAEGDRVQVQLGTIHTVEQFGSDVLIVHNLVDQVVLVNVQLSSLPSGWIFEV